MLHTLQQAFREAVRNFHEALEEPSESDARPRGREAAPADGGLTADLVLLQSTLSRLEDEVQRTRSALALERQALEACERRGLLAAEIEDAETVALAQSYAEEHRTHLAILVEKEDVLRRELMHHRQRLQHLLILSSAGPSR
jgi:flagellar biosynthesis chaperone FliJ